MVGGRGIHFALEEHVTAVRLMGPHHVFCDFLCVVGSVPVPLFIWPSNVGKVGFLGVR